MTRHTLTEVEQVYVGTLAELRQIKWRRLRGVAARALRSGRITARNPGVLTSVVSQDGKPGRVQQLMLPRRYFVAFDHEHIDAYGFWAFAESAYEQGIKWPPEISK